MQNEAFSRLRNEDVPVESYVDHDLNRDRQRGRERTFRNSSHDPIIKKSGMSISFFFFFFFPYPFSIQRTQTEGNKEKRSMKLNDLMAHGTGI